MEWFGIMQEGVAGVDGMVGAGETLQVKQEVGGHRMLLRQRFMAMTLQ